MIAIYSYDTAMFVDGDLNFTNTCAKLSGTKALKGSQTTIENIPVGFITTPTDLGMVNDGNGGYYVGTGGAITPYLEIGIWVDEPDPEPEPGPTPGPTPGPSPSPWPISGGTTKEPEVDPVKDCPRDNTCILSKFEDVDPSEWYHDPLHYFAGNGILKGTTSTKADPGGNITRGQMITMLWRMDGEKKVASLTTFEDVPEGMYYEEAIKWAYANKIVDGFDKLHFGPDKFITREQMAQMMYKYAVYTKDATAENGANISQEAAEASLNYNDKADISSWAAKAVYWCTKNGVCQGVGEGIFRPQGTATRAQALTMMYNLVK